MGCDLARGVLSPSARAMLVDLRQGLFPGDIDLVEIARGM